MGKAVYDYVIVGAGAAGCVLANRLTASGTQRVLLIEAGGTDKLTNVQIPAAFGKLFKSEHDWAFFTEPQPGAAERMMYWPRGKLLGGSSSMNAQMWIRGHKQDFEHWRELGNPGWGYDDVAPLFSKIASCKTGPNDSYGEQGPMVIEDLRDPNISTRAFLSACREAGLRELPDHNMADNEGYALTRVNQKRGRRFSAADGYLYPVMGRKNLTVATKCVVQKIELRGQRAVGVRYRTDKGRVLVAEARREVILAAGSIGSPQLLMLSGIGAGEQLSKLGIDVVVDRPAVGDNLQDHLLTGMMVNCPLPVTLLSAESPLNLLKYFALRKGMLTSCVAEAAAFVRTQPGLTAPDIELIWAPVPYIEHGFVVPTAHGLGIGTVLLQPQSRGRLALQSSHPEAPPSIDPRYLSDPGDRDLQTIVAGLRMARHLMTMPSLRPYIGEPLLPGPEVADTDEALGAYVRAKTETLYHPVGTCRMGSDADAVVDPALNVRGIEGLRVADASIMPRITRGHTQAPTLMIAEKAAELILEGALGQARASYGAAPERASP
ncbi:MAG: Choline dehydrogenase [Myxococcaceae bacterium]|nr:Choline dehydrogenase [Myxococcaceae bacterium]